MNTLIVYSTKHGAAGKCAQMLSEKIGGSTDVANLKGGKVPELSGYDRVIIGGSIYGGMVQKELKQFCAQNLDSLRNKKLGFYLCCMFKDKFEMQLAANFPQELLSIAVAKECFGAEMKFSDMNFGEKLLTKMVSKVIAKTSPETAAIDMKKDASMLSLDAIDRFAHLF